MSLYCVQSSCEICCGLVACITKNGLFVVKYTHMPIMSYLFMNFLNRILNFDSVQQIVKTIEINDVVVISGETGCGKTTQVLAVLY